MILKATIKLCDSIADRSVHFVCAENSKMMTEIQQEIMAMIVDFRWLQKAEIKWN